MPFTIDKIPPRTDVLALAALGPKEAPSDPHVQSLLLPILEVCRTTWINKFLFTRDPIHVKELDTPMLSDRAITCLVNTTRVEGQTFDSTNSTEHGEIHQYRGGMLFVPSFTVDHITAGFGIAEGTEKSSIPWLCMRDGHATKNSVVNFRFVRDSRRRLMVIVYDIPDDDGILLHYSTIETTTLTHTFTARFHRNQLLGSLRKENGILVSQNLLPCLHVVQSTYQHRRCWNCRSHTRDLCDCSMPIRETTHPFDLEYFSASMQEHLGSYEGVATKVLYLKGRKVKSRVMGCHVSSEGVVDPSMVTRMRNWALRVHMRGKVQDPKQSLRLPSHSTNQPKDSVREHGRKTERDCALGTFGDHDVIDDGFDVDLMIDPLADNKNLSTCCQDTSQVHGGFNIGAAFKWIDNGSYKPNSSQEDYVTHTPRQLARYEQPWTAARPGAMFTETSQQPIERCNSNGAARHPEVARFPQTAIFSAPRSPFSNPDAKGISLGVSSSPLYRNAASPTSPKDMCQAVGSKQELENDDSVNDACLIENYTKLKADLRRERNKLSAFKSNEKVRAKRDALDLQVRHAREKVSLLRDKEIFLRQENLRLKVLLTQLSGEVI